MVALVSMAIVWILVGCVGAVNVAASTAATSRRHVTVSTPQSELAAVKRVKWTSNVTVSLSNGSWTFRSDGDPASSFTASHYAVPQNPLSVTANGASVISASQVLRNQNYNFTIPTTPRYSSETTTNLGAIGVMLDGAVLYNPYEANKETVATNDNFSATVNGTTASFLDTCDGHPGPGGQYHYHGLPECLVQYASSGRNTQTTSVTSFTGATTASVAENNAAARKPVLLGFTFDGYGIYDNVAMDGKAIPVSSLDRCNGLFSRVPGYPDGVYHYVLENVRTNRSSINCYHGIVSSSYLTALKDSINAIAGRGPTARPAWTPLSSSGLSSVPDPVDGVPSTARSLSANKSEIRILMVELNALGHGQLC
jgi:hypothetical protein